jgi:GrpB-like predicted nucleotidyltransferase (UPF0157 family)
MARPVEHEAARIRQILGTKAILIEHVGSTAIRGLIAKPIIDIVLVVANSADEASYVHTLEAAGYRLRIRSPAWDEHRLLKGPDTDINLHGFSRGSAEIHRMVRFRDCLRADPDERERYAATKRALARRHWAYMQDYADAKGPIIEDILTRAAPAVDGGRVRRA